MATHGLGSPRFGRCRMATGIGLRPFWPLLCGISRRIVSKPRTDTLETSINASHSLDMLGYYLLQVVWYVLPIFLCDVGNVLRNFGNELRSALVGPAVAWVQVIITAIDQYCPERWKNPMSVWGMVMVWRQVKINKVRNSDNRNIYLIYTWFITAFQPPKKTITHPSAS